MRTVALDMALVTSDAREERFMANAQVYTADEFIEAHKQLASAKVYEMAAKDPDGLVAYIDRFPEIMVHTQTRFTGVKVILNQQGIPDIVNPFQNEYLVAAGQRFALKQIIFVVPSKY